MQGAPSTHFTSFAQAVLYRGAGPDVVRPQLAAMTVIDLLIFILAVWRFRRGMSASR